MESYRLYATSGPTLVPGKELCNQKKKAVLNKELLELGFLKEKEVK
jgi:hypothetical protein